MYTNYTWHLLHRAHGLTLSACYLLYYLLSYFCFNFSRIGIIMSNFGRFPASSLLQIFTRRAICEEIPGGNVNRRPSIAICRKLNTYLCYTTWSASKILFILEWFPFTEKKFNNSNFQSWSGQFKVLLRLKKKREVSWLMSGEFFDAVHLDRLCVKMGKYMQNHPHVFMRNIYITFSSIWIVALWSVYKTFQESYDFAATLKTVHQMMSKTIDNFKL
jgi:hypothetical protein